MVDQRYSDVLYPPTHYVELFHRVIILQKGTAGWGTKLVDVGIEWAKTLVDYELPSPGVLVRAAAMLYAYTTFHAFADGNKRTALMSTSFFLYLNQYEFDITNDAPEFTRGLAERCREKAHSSKEEIARTLSWLAPRARPFQGRTSKLIRTLMQMSIPSGLPHGSIMDSPLWQTYFLNWLKKTAGRFEELKGQNGPEHPTATNLSPPS